MSDDDKEHGGGREAFFHCLDRVPSGLHIDSDFPSDDDEDDVRFSSFVSAMGDHKSFRRYQAAVLEEEVEDTSKCYMWMVDETMSIQGRRGRLHRGPGLASSRYLALRRHSKKKRPADVARRVSRLQSSTSLSALTKEPSTATAPVTSAVAATHDVLTQQPAKAITRRRSDSILAVRDSAPGSGKPPSPTLRRARSFPTRHAACDSSPIEKVQAVATRDMPPVPLTAAPPADKGGKGDGGKDGDVESDCGTKKQDNDKEVAVVANDSPSNTQTGVQLGLEEFEKFIGNTPIVKHLMHRSSPRHGAAQGRQADGEGSIWSIKFSGRRLLASAGEDGVVRLASREGQRPAVLRGAGRVVGPLPPLPPLFTSADSQIRAFHGVTMVQKFR